MSSAVAEIDVPLEESEAYQVAELKACDKINQNRSSDNEPAREAQNGLSMV